MSKIKVAVLRGGPSNEYEVSLKTGSTLLKHLHSMSDKYETHDVLITKDGLWHINGFERSPEKVAQQIDVFVNGLHGSFGEDGKVQQMLESFNAAYTGSGTLASALAMNKKFTKEIAKKNGIKTAIHTIVRAGENTWDRVLEIFKTFPHPSVVKPVASGSSVGVSIAYTALDLEQAIAEALTHSDTAIIEEFISGREATCGIVNNFRNETLYALPPVEIVKPQKSAFFDYHAKYSGQSTEICPGNFSHAEREMIQTMSKQIHEALGLRHYSRSDFIVSPRRGVYFLETNTLPGMTNESLFPKSLEAVGVTIPHFLDHLIALALEAK